MSRFKTKIFTTTQAYDDYELEVFEYDREDAEYFVRQASVVDIGFSVFGFFLNIFHFLILTRKSLRTQFIFQVFIIICLSDLILFSGTLIWNYLDYIVGSVCNKPRPYSHQIWRLVIMSSQSIMKNLSLLLVLLLSGLQIFSFELKFPIKDLIVFGIAGLCTAWQVWYFNHYTIVTARDCGVEPKLKFKSYELSIDVDFLADQKLIHDCMKIVPFFLYNISFVIQFVQLRKVIRKKSGENDQIIFVLMLTFSFLLSEYIDATVILFDHALLKPYYLIQEYFIRLRIVANTLTTMNCVTHCFICMLMSSDYMDTVRKCLRREKKEKINAQKNVPSVTLTIESSHGDVA
ncbi:hypothetical protein CRE_07808 [Caenorhabditis remanei]|uniref:G-protein coupled receptors family 1 profile domain-containing protein n=1 Tax=Caenorhabditis remanei TaxID=31234 RepID=E3NEI8_CAERE|nr:hypothetical protein CRE_07808 [Caenorhabditis remanei]